MGIDSHGNNGHSHSHTGCFPFLPIPIPNFVTNSHYHGNPHGIPIPNGNPIPMVIYIIDVDILSIHTGFRDQSIQYNTDSASQQVDDEVHISVQGSRRGFYTIQQLYSSATRSFQ